MKSKWFILLLFGSVQFAQEIIGEGFYEQNLIDFLRMNYKTSSTLSYNAARDTLYLNVDRTEEGQVMGIYTNYTVDLPASGVDPSSHLYTNGMDCEHVWPQSMYDDCGSDDDCNMRCDMHHLRPCKTNVNSSRGNKPFGEIQDSQTQKWYWKDIIYESTMPTSDIDEYSETKTGYFEPREDRKGDIARSIFYFYTMYSEVADENFFDVQKDVLKTWHEQDPADTNELNRTWQIAGYQQNKPNPFILDPTLIYRAYFYEGGDVNGDGLINILDIIEVVDIILSNGIPDPAADINSDGEIDVVDIVMLVSLILS